MSFWDMSSLRPGGQIKCEIVLDEQEKRRTHNHPKLGKVPIYENMERVGGTVTVAPSKAGKKIEHGGIKIELVGEIETSAERTSTHSFTRMTRELELPGEMLKPKTYNFEFTNAEKLHESYVGVNIKLRYYVRVLVVRRVMDFTQEKELWVQRFHEVPVVNNSIKMEVGIEESLHIEFEYSKSSYHLKDVIVGKIYFLLVRIKIKHMELKLVRRESITGAQGQKAFVENSNVTAFEIMDGAPSKGESIPIRFFLGGHDLTPTMRDVHKKFSVTYLINLVLVDEGDRRYFKQQEITMWRPKDYNKVSNMSEYVGKREIAAAENAKAAAAARAAKIEAARAQAKA